MTPRDALKTALHPKVSPPIILIRKNDDRQYSVERRAHNEAWRVKIDGELFVQVRYMDGSIPECPWFSFEGFSVEDVLADDWEFM